MVNLQGPNPFSERENGRMQLVGCELLIRSDSHVSHKEAINIKTAESQKMWFIFNTDNTVAEFLHCKMSVST